MLEQVNKIDIPLYVDVNCYVCSRTVALSNSVKIGGRDLCPRCAAERDGDMNEVYGATRLVCVGCNKTPSEIPEYVEAARDSDFESFDSADDYVRSEEGTLNKRNGHFMCTDCYVKAGCPSSPQGWVAP